MAKVYYNQKDSKWSNHPYPSANHPSATVGTSGCGTTCAAMVVSSCKEIIRPDTMSDISMENGYRGLEGTSDGLFSYVSNRWGIEMKTLHSSFEAHQACKEGYFVVICCGAGLWTTGGHYILAVGANDTEIEIYDPYLYNGKFDKLGRQGKVRLEGISAWVEINTFKANSNAQRFYAFKINEQQESTTETPVNMQPQIKKIAWVNTASLPLNVRDKANGNIIGSVAKGTKVTIHETQGSWARIDQGWVSLSYLSYTEPQSQTTSIKYVKVNSALNVRNGAGAGYSIVKTISNGTKVTVYEENNGWSKISEGEWVSSQYLVSEVSQPVNTNKYKLGRYKVIANTLNVRSGAGTNYPIKKTYKKNTVFDTYEIKNSWARTPSGWCCLEYCSLMYKY